MLSKVKRNNEKGFTLIELMIVIAIIGILAAIAIPQFSAYRTRSYNSVAESDLRNAATAQEAFYVDNQRYCNTIGYVMRAWHQSGNNSFIIRGPGGSVSKMH